MANIAITNYCNLQCPYCFADRFIKEEDKEMITLNQLEKILEFLGRSTVGRVGLIGGEPTIHPEFSTILDTVSKFCDSHNSHCVVFTNGIRLYEYARQITPRIGCLINVNHPDIVGESKWKDMIRSLDRVKLCSGSDNMNIGINLYPDMLDYSYIFEVAKRYQKSSIRTSYVAPTCKYKDVNKDDYYMNAKELFIPFVEKAKSLGIHIRLDCNHIPLCYFTDSELSIIESSIEGYKEYCEPVIDITPDFKGTACFGAYELIDLERFNNILEVSRYLSFKKIYPLTEKNCTGKCSTCSKHQNLSCQGGCLAFANH